MFNKPHNETLHEHNYNETHNKFLNLYQPCLAIDFYEKKIILTDLFQIKVFPVFKLQSDPCFSYVKIHTRFNYCLCLLLSKRT